MPRQRGGYRLNRGGGFCGLEVRAWGLGFRVWACGLGSGLWIRVGVEAFSALGLRV